MGLDERRASVRDGMKFRVNILFQNTIFRYLFGIAVVASTFALRIWLIPLTGTGAPFVLFFAAVLVTSLLPGWGLRFARSCSACPSAPTHSWCAQVIPFSSGLSGAAVRNRRGCRRLSDVSHETGAPGSPRRQSAAARRKRRDHEIDGADPRDHRACARCILSGGSQCPLHGRQSGCMPDARLRPERVNWQDNLRYRSDRGCSPAGNGQG